VTLFWIAVGGAACYAVSLYLWPFRPCSRCGGSGRNRGSNHRRFGTCGRCGGSGRHQRPGSKFVHNTVLSVMAERRKAKEKRGRERGEL
jgi:DnaJ-class molecular chaperone